MIIISYMEYQTLNKMEKTHGPSIVSQDLWQSIVLVGVLVIGALDAIRF